MTALVAPSPKLIAPEPPFYSELVTTSNFSFLRSGSHPEEMVAAAMHLGMTALGLCDRNTFAGVVRGYVTARENKELFPHFRYLVGVRLAFADGTPDIIAYPTNRVAYGRLCKLLTLGNQRGEKGKDGDNIQGDVAAQRVRHHLRDHQHQGRDRGNRPNGVGRFGANRVIDN